MVVRIHNVGKWLSIQPGHSLVLVGLQARKIRIEVNCPAPTRFDVVDEAGVVTFLAVVQGHELLEFTSQDAVCTVTPTSEEDVYYFTNDGDNVTFETFEASMTKIVGRKARNPDLERLMFKMEQNVNRRMAQQADEFKAMNARRDAVAAAKAAEAEAVANEGDDGDGDTAGDARGATGAAGATGEPVAKEGAGGAS